MRIRNHGEYKKQNKNLIIIVGGVFIFPRRRRRRNKKNIPVLRIHAVPFWLATTHTDRNVFFFFFFFGSVIRSDWREPWNNSIDSGRKRQDALSAPCPADRPSNRWSNGYRFSHADEAPFGRDFTNSNQGVFIPFQVSSHILYKTRGAYFLFFFPLRLCCCCSFFLSLHFTSFLDWRCDSGGPHHKRFELASNKRRLREEEEEEEGRGKKAEGDRTVGRNNASDFNASSWCSRSDPRRAPPRVEWRWRRRRQSTRESQSVYYVLLAAYCDELTFSYFPHCSR